MRLAVVGGKSVRSQEVLDALAAKHSPRPGDVVRQGGIGGEPAQEWIGDGVLRWADRVVTGAVLRWPRPATSDGEKADLDQRLVPVPDDHHAWIRLESAP